MKKLAAILAFALFSTTASAQIVIVSPSGSTGGGGGGGSVSLTGDETVTGSKTMDLTGGKKFSIIATDSETPGTGTATVGEFGNAVSFSDPSMAGAFGIGFHFRIDTEESVVTYVDYLNGSIEVDPPMTPVEDADWFFTPAATFDSYGVSNFGEMTAYHVMANQLSVTGTSDFTGPIIANTLDVENRNSAPALAAHMMRANRLYFKYYDGSYNRYIGTGADNNDYTITIDTNNATSGGFAVSPAIGVSGPLRNSALAFSSDSDIGNASAFISKSGSGNLAVGNTKGASDGTIDAAKYRAFNVTGANSEYAELVFAANKAYLRTGKTGSGTLRDAYFGGNNTVIDAAGNIYFQSARDGSPQTLYLDTGGSLILDNGKLGSAGYPWQTAYIRVAAIGPTSAATVPLKVQAAAAQSANLIEATSDGGTAGDLFKVLSDGTLNFNGGTIRNNIILSGGTFHFVPTGQSIWFGGYKVGLGSNANDVLSLYDAAGIAGAGTLQAKSVQLSTAAQPTCSSTYAGAFWYTAGGVGVKDSVVVCAKDAANVYAWRTIY